MKPTDIFKYGVRNELMPKFHWHNIKNTLLYRTYRLSVLKILILILIFLILGMLVMVGGRDDCPAVECPECKECAACICPEFNESECPTKEKIKPIVSYVCSDGTVAGDEEDCEWKKERIYICEDGSEVLNRSVCDLAEEIDITTEHQHTAFNVTVAIDSVDFEMKGDNWGTITNIGYTVLNEGESTIMPKLYVRVYNESDNLMRQTETRGTITIDRTLENGEWIKEKQDVYISFKGLNTTVKLVLMDTIPDPDKTLVLVGMPLDIE